MARRPFLTIGMACYENYAEFWHTMQGLRVYHDLSRVEILVSDNAKVKSRDSLDMESRMKGHFHHHCAMATYIHSHEIQGTAYPREMIFRRASGKYVCVIDPHIYLQQNGVANLIKYFEQHPDSNDLIQGPMWGDDLEGIQTCWRDGWRSFMWGKWGNVFESQSGLRFSVEDNNGKCQFVTTGINPLPLTKEEIKEHRLPVHLSTGNHEKTLEALGFKWLGKDESDEFEIPGMGLGLFACRREAWPHFNSNFKGFGGEEMYIHDKFRQRGDKAICRGDLKWVHKFRRDGEINYSHTTWDKVRNYVNGRLEKGNIRDQQMQDIFDEFVAQEGVPGSMPMADWQYLLADPVKNWENPDFIRYRQANPGQQMQDPTPQTQNQNPQGTRKIMKQNLTNVYMALKGTERDLNQHMEKFAELANKCQSVTEFSRRRESAIGFAFGNPEKLVSFNTEGEILNQVELPPGREYMYSTADSMEIEEIEETDLLFLDTVHTKERVQEELRRFGGKVKRFIVFHDMISFGLRGEDGGPGITEAVREFMEDNPEWFGYYNTDKQYGLGVIGRLEEDRPAEQVHLWVPEEGVGRELMEIIEHVFGIIKSEGCDCEARAKLMNIWGIDACEKDKFEDCVKLVRENYVRWGWGAIAPNGEPALENGAVVDFTQDVEYLSPTTTTINPEDIGPTRKFSAAQIAANLFKSGLIWRINPLKPFDSLILECIRRAKIRRDFLERNKSK